MNLLVRKTSRLLIICPLADIYSGVGNFGAPPLGPWRLAHYLQANGQHVDVWDCNVSAALKLPAPDEHGTRARAEVLAEAFVAGIEGDFGQPAPLGLLARYDFIGFSILSDTLPTTLGVIELIKKKYPHVKLVGGNHESTVNLGDCIGKSHLDGVILADAEEPMLALMRGAVPSSVPGVLWRNFNPKPPREKFEEWNRLIRWGEIPYEAYWSRTRSLYNWETMSPEEQLDKQYEIQTVRVHSIVACELACTYSVSGDTLVVTKDGPIEIAKLALGEGVLSACEHGDTFVDYAIETMVATPGGWGMATHLLDEGVRPILRIVAEDRAIKATPEHRFLCEGNTGLEWRRADELKIHDMVFTKDVDRSNNCHPRRIIFVEPCASERVYDITVPGEEAFVANGFVAHNCSVANTRRIASGSTKPSIVNLSPVAIEENLLAIKRTVPGVMTIYDSSDEAWLGRGRAEEYLSVLEKIKPVMDEGLPRGMRYLIQCRTNDLTEEIIRRAGAVGVRHLTIGIESPIAQVRKDIKKPQGEDLIRNAMKWGAEHNVEIYGLFIMFLPSITLEQLREAVTNWRIYMELGATISVEPFCMSYLGTAMHDDPSFITEHVGYDIPFSGGKKLKWATLIWPHDRRVCALLSWFRAHVDAYIEEARKKLGHRHTFKGTTGKITVDCLEAALTAYDRGEVTPWEPGEGQRSMVYQDYGDQMSGSEIAAAAMDRRNTTATRFNSTHSLLDHNSGVAGRIKDPALPHEMTPKKDDEK